ncbi:hypothetical protein OSB04_023826 [Centaurea solstitialis]|uniref:Reverse transcriptase RNase H-like domain-containing protein n=1 Tax=Centaurea solstitialis TaxID=347529 RepID=A0AA38SLN0_9ASTR|nr:hypothetical protein OSB04_023826 [Centaurea solstitialis]
MVRRRDIPLSTVSDRDARLYLDAWRSFQLDLGTRVTSSTANHLHSDEQSERVIQLWKIRWGHVFWISEVLGVIIYRLRRVECAVRIRQSVAQLGQDQGKIELLEAKRCRALRVAWSVRSYDSYPFRNLSCGGFVPHALLSICDPLVSYNIGYGKPCYYLAHNLNRHYLYGVKCTIYIDHRRLRYFIDQLNLNMRQQKWLEQM